MNADFLDSHLRHWEDAEVLYSQQKLAGADHLYGISWECGLKRLMLAFNMPFDQVKDMPADPQDRKHADGLLQRYESYRSGYHQGISYGLPSENPFSDWNISQRYSNRSDFTEISVQKHRDGAKLALDLVSKALFEGIIY